jgi:hypothetical protein
MSRGKQMRSHARYPAALRKHVDDRVQDAGDAAFGGAGSCGCTDVGVSLAASTRLSYRLDAPDFGPATRCSMRSTVRCSAANLRTTWHRCSALVAAFAWSRRPSSCAACRRRSWKWPEAPLLVAARRGSQTCVGSRCACPNKLKRTQSRTRGLQHPLHLVGV